MNPLAHLRVSTRMRLLIGLALVGLLILCATALVQLRDGMLQDRRERTKNLVEVGIGVLAHYHQLAAQGKMPEDEAKKAARETLRGLRYGDNDYYFSFGTDGVYFLYPTKPEWEGQDKRDFKDTQGKLLVQELIAAARRGGGFVDYWFPRAGQETAEPKLAYAATFAPWDLVLGTGIYVSDVDREFRHAAALLGGIALALLAALSVFGTWVSRSILRQLGGEPADAVATMQRIAAGDLTVDIPAARPGSLCHAVGTMTAALRELVREINASAGELVRHAKQISDAAREVNRAAEQESEATAAIAAAIEELTVSSSHISATAQDTEEESRSAMSLADDGAHRVDQAGAAIERTATTIGDISGRIHTLEERARQITTIASAIKDIAGQTNLLALNAAIEAARAGDQGRGFAVVADEVRKLAERTAVATTEIDQMISGIQGDTLGASEAMTAALPEVVEGIGIAESAAESLKAIEQGAQRTLGRVAEVAAATREQSSASTSIAQRVEEIARMVDETSGAIRATAENAARLERIALTLERQMSRFRV